MSGYKWRLVIQNDSAGISYYLQPLCKDLRGIDAKYIHAPGDVDYSELSKLSYKDKARILYNLLTKNSYAATTDTLGEISNLIRVDQITSPKFIPKELDPDI